MDAVEEVDAEIAVAVEEEDAEIAVADGTVGAEIAGGVEAASEASLEPPFGSPRCVPVERG